jgi:hypothetical protein
VNLLFDAHTCIETMCAKKYEIHYKLFYNNISCNGRTWLKRPCSIKLEINEKKRGRVSATILSIENTF